MDFIKKIQARSVLARSCRAVEIGTTAVRVVALKKRGKRVQVIEAGEEALPRTEAGPPPPAVVEKALSRLLAKSKFREEVLYSSLPIHKVFIRSLVLPFTRLTQLRQVIASEVELHVPFPLDQIVIDFWPVEELKGEKTRVVMVAVKKTVLQAHLDTLRACGLDPTAVGLDCLGLAQAYFFSGLLNPDEVTVLLDVGAVHVGAAFCFRGTVQFLRSFAGGGDTITAAVREEMGCDFTEAENLKSASDLDPSTRSRVEGAVAGAFNSLEAELARTLHSAASEMGGHPPRNVILSGGALLQAGLREFLVRAIGLPVLDINPFAAAIAKLPPPPGITGSFGLALSAVTPGRAKVDLRREEFSFQGSWKTVKRRLFVAAGLTAALIAILASGILLKIKMEKNKYHRLGDRIQALLRETTPEAENLSPGEELSAVKNVIDQMREEFKYYRDFASISALEILREISRVIPADIRVQMVELEVDQKRVRMVGRTDSFRSAERIKNSLQKSDYFQADKIKEGDSKTKKDRGKIVTVEFNYTIPLIQREI